jgi:type II secretory pathway component PulF
MTVYEYAAYDPQGHRNQGEIEAPGKDQAQEKIQAMGLIPIELAPRKEGLASSVPNLRYLIFREPSVKEVELFISEVSILLNNGIRLNRALEMVSRNIVHPRLRQTVRNLYERIRKGDSLHASMEAYPRYFDRMVLNLVELGENTGKLGELFREISDHMKFRSQMRAKVIQSLTYPFFILSVCLLSLLFIFYFVVPRFAAMFAEMEAIPVYTSLLLAISDFVTHYLIWIVAGGIVFAFLASRLARGAYLSGLKDRVALTVPLVRSLTEGAERLRFAKSMTILLRNQIQLDRCLSLAVSFVNNRVIRSRLLPVVGSVKGGGTCAGALKATHFFPPFFLNLVEIGEETGHMAGVFGEISEELRMRFDQTLERIIALIEPIAIIFMALMVGSIIIIIMLSIISTYDIQI